MNQDQQASSAMESRGEGAAGGPPPLPGASEGRMGEVLTPVSSVAEAVDALLRQPARLLENGKVGMLKPLILAWIILILAGGVVYGVVMGAFSGGDQMWKVPLKFLGGMLVAAVICLPSLYVFGGLSGSRARLGHVVAMTGAMCALMALMLLGLAPISWVFSESTTSAAVMGTFHLAVWGIAFVFGGRLMLRGFAVLDGGAAAGLKVWLGLFLAVNLQMSTALRPMLGKSDHFFPTEKKLFLAHWYDTVNGVKTVEPAPLR